MFFLFEVVSRCLRALSCFMFRAFAKVVNSQNFGLVFLFALSEGDCGPRTPSTTAGFSRLGLPARQHVRSVIAVTLIHLGVAQLERCGILSTHHVCMTSRSSEVPKVPYGLTCEPLQHLQVSNDPMRTDIEASIRLRTLPLALRAALLNAP